MGKGKEGREKERKKRDSPSLEINFWL